MSEHATTHAVTHAAGTAEQAPVQPAFAQPAVDIEAQRALMETTIARCERLHVVPHLQGLSFDTLITHAIAYRNGMLFNDAATHGYNINYVHLHELDRADCERHVINMLRHAGTEYDAALASIDPDAPGSDIAAAYIREHTYMTIAATYPTLTAECGRQMLARGLAPGQALATLRVREMRAGVTEAVTTETVTLAPAQVLTTEPKPATAPAKQAQQPAQQPAATQQTQKQPAQKQQLAQQQPAKKAAKAQQQPKQQPKQK